MKKVCIINSGYANLYSVHNALNLLGHENFISEKAEEINTADAFILPGVGSFGQVQEHLDNTGLTSIIQDIAKSGKPMLGICLGMQLLFDTSHETIENNGVNGLGLISGDVIPLPKDQVKRIPHIGWNKLYTDNNESFLFKDFDRETAYVYFVHSFQCKPQNSKDLLAHTLLGPKNDVEVAAIVQKDNITGMQFHPERSGKSGLKLLDNFIKNACNA